MSKEAELIAEHRWSERHAGCSCTWQPDYSNTHKSGVLLHAAHVVSKLSEHGYSIVETERIERLREFSAMTVQSFREVEKRGSLYDAATHRCVELLADETTRSSSGSAEPIHNYGCDEWCNHCQVCGTGVLYGSRCHAHRLPYAAAAAAEEDQ